MHLEYDPASARLTLNGREVATHPTAGWLREASNEPDTIVVHPQHAARLTAAMVVTPEDEARVDRAKAKRARRAAARRVG